ncbi:MAG: hypothetical protein GWM90_06365, partial [Gemmatimonadetes bacterium]|nr:hypothetical protein [Gemmatimonadota bacterium]NIQ53404.1 hypothetical protein [Gemmatimonadota bacterium]NIU73547.1 hypothetical protein [Gammaproteobacteria bacterium]NIX18639.1 hypothetical protein [Actinomycetota bacterium]NIX43747.1 hypothetical protein [Gemmatimonadota bacterium]
AALAVALLAAGATTARLEWGARHWDTVASSRERQLAARLEDRVQGVVRRARAATALAAGEGRGAFDA